MRTGARAMPGERDEGASVLRGDVSQHGRAIHAEGACIERGVAGRLIPLPVQINADCGLAWRMEPAERPTFERVMQDEGIDAGYVDLML